MINVNNFKIWTTALRLEGYPQTRGRIHRVEDDGSNEKLGYCPIGVGCVKAGVEEMVITLDGKKMVLFNSGRRRFVSAPDKFSAWLGLDSHVARHHQFVQDCTRWNDLDELTFEDIADNIEAWVIKEVYHAEE